MSIEQCRNTAGLRYTWPGSNEKIICIECATRLKRIASAIGLHLQVIPIDTEKKCDQMKRN